MRHINYFYASYHHENNSTYLLTYRSSLQCDVTKADTARIYGTDASEIENLKFNNDSGYIVSNASNGITDPTGAQVLFYNLNCNII